MGSLGRLRIRPMWYPTLPTYSDGEYICPIGGSVSTTADVQTRNSNRLCIDVSGASAKHDLTAYLRSLVAAAYTGGRVQIDPRGRRTGKYRPVQDPGQRFTAHRHQLPVSFLISSSAVSTSALCRSWSSRGSQVNSIAL